MVCMSCDEELLPWLEENVVIVGMRSPQSGNPPSELVRHATQQEIVDGPIVVLDIFSECRSELKRLHHGSLSVKATENLTESVNGARWITQLLRRWNQDPLHDAACWSARA